MLKNLLILLLIIFLAVEIGPFPARAGKQLPQEKEMTAAMAADSLNILDSLVNAFLIKDNKKACRYANSAVRIAAIIKTTEARVRAMNLTGMTFSNRYNDSAYYCYVSALRLARPERLTRQMSRLYYNIAMLCVIAGDFRNGMNYIDSSLACALAVHDHFMTAAAYNISGNIRFSVHDVTGAKEMYEKAFYTASRDSISRLMGTSLGNLADFEESDSRYIEKISKALFYLKKSYGCEKEIASFYNNIGTRITDPDSALDSFTAALKTIRGSEIPEVEILTRNNMVYPLLKKGKTVEALRYLDEYAIPLALKEQNHDWLSTLYDTRADVLSARGLPGEAVLSMKQAVAERQEAERENAAGQVRLLSAMLDLKNKEIMIRTRENEILAANSSLARTRVLLIVAVLCITGLIFIVLWVRQKSIARLREQQIGSAKRIIAMEEAEKEKLSGELHDITGQLMLGVLSQVEQFDFSEKRKKIELKERISGLGSRIRQISHRIGSSHMEDLGFEELIRGLCEDMEAFTGIPVGIEIDIRGTIVPSGDSLLHIYRITQELLTNAGKYADGARVEISMKAYDGKLDMTYHDDGPGFSDQGSGRHGIGIMNIMERAKLLGGNAAVNSIPGQGVSWEISIPLKERKNWSKN